MNSIISNDFLNIKIKFITIDFLLIMEVYYYKFYPLYYNISPKTSSKNTNPTIKVKPLHFALA